jgi:hypothetical protein
MESSLQEMIGEYETIMEIIEEKNIILKELYEKSTLPEEVNFDKLDQIYREMILIGEK